MRGIVQKAAERGRETVVLLCFLYPPTTFLDPSLPHSGHVRVVDRTADVPGYSSNFDGGGDAWRAQLKKDVLDIVHTSTL